MEYLEFRNMQNSEVGMGGRLNYTRDGGLVGPEGSVTRLRSGNAVPDMPLGAVRLWDDKQQV